MHSCLFTYMYVQVYITIPVTALLPQSPSPSHSVGVNYQRVLAAMKSHSPLLCGAVAGSRGRVGGASGRKAPPPVTPAELRSLLAGLEEEFGQLTL